MRKFYLLLMAGALAPSAWAQKTEMVAVSADIMEISGSIHKERGFTWTTDFEFLEMGSLSVF